jgi:SMODS-associated and fused to various effectors sensor domain
MSLSSVPEKVRLRLWGKAAGRCEYDGCNMPLWLDLLTQTQFNVAYVAHIIADRPDGPRGDPILSEELKADPTNLMLLCDAHHRLIDKEDLVGHTVERLRSMKARHEDRIALVGSIGPNKQSHVLLYGANIGAHSSNLCLQKAAEAMVPEWYPAESRPLELGLVNSSFTDRDSAFWEIESTHLRRVVAQQIRPRLAQGSVRHLSVFALAPQPLLALLGYLLSDIPAADVYQLHREPPDWKWQAKPSPTDLVIEEPRTIVGEPALVVSLSATIMPSRVMNVLSDPTLWQISHPNPHNDVLKTRKQATAFRSAIRRLLNRIKARHGQDATIHVFPAMPVALAVELGRIVMPKADLPLRIYDENRYTGGFSNAIELTPLMLSAPGLGPLAKVS